MNMRQIELQITLAVNTAKIEATSNFRNDHTNLLWEASKVLFEGSSSNVACCKNWVTISKL